MIVHDMSRRRRPSSDSMIAAAAVAVSVTLLSAYTTTEGPSVLETIQGKWSIVSTSVTEVGADGSDCRDGNGVGSFEIVGSDLRGTFVGAKGTIFDLSASVSNTGAVELGFAVAKRTVVRAFGDISEGGGSGDWESVSKCRGTWTAVKS